MFEFLFGYTFNINDITTVCASVVIVLFLIASLQQARAGMWYASPATAALAWWFIRWLAVRIGTDGVRRTPDDSRNAEFVRLLGHPTAVFITTFLVWCGMAFYVYWRVWYIPRRNRKA